MAQFTPEKLHEMFVYHPPTPEAITLHDAVNSMCEGVAREFNERLPQSPETTLAIRALQDARHWANAAVALYVTAGQK